MRRSAYFDRLLAGVRRSPDTEREELIAFRAQMYGPHSIHADPTWVRWMFDEIPGAQSVGPALWTWRRGDRIAAQQGAVRSRIRIQGVEYDLGWAVELMVAPEQRARGIGAVLPQKVLDEFTVVGGTEVSEAAQKSFTRSGWSHLGNLTQWVRPVNARAFVRERMPQLPEGPVGLIAGTVLGGLRHLTRAAHRRYRLVPVEQFDTRADHVWSSCAPHWPVIACRDGEWLRWRWGACPRARPNALWLEKDGETVGWAVLGRREHGSLNAGFIVDLLCEPRDLSALLSLAVDHFYRAGVDAVYCLFQAPGVDATLASCGFLRRDSGFAMMVYSDKLPAEVRNTLADASQWFVTSGDSNLERPRENTQYA